MVLSRDEFMKNKIAPNIIRMGANEFNILELLYENEDNAFTMGEIQRKLKMKYLAAVNSALKSLKRKKLVDVRRVDGYNYWRSADGETMDNIREQYKKVGGGKPINNEDGIKDVDG